MALRVTNETRGRILADQAEEARGLLGRLRGLMGRRELPVGGGLLISPCNSIHMFFMHFSIDALFLDRGGRVVKLVAALPPWRLTPIYWRARSVLELPAGVGTASGTQVGDLVLFEEIP